jgi:PAS domain S-box-containing protein
LFRIFDFDPATMKPSLSELLKRVHPEDRRDVEKKVNRAILKGHSLEHDYRLMFADGSIKHIHAALHPLTHRSGKIREIVATATNVTDRVRSESELRRSEAYLAEVQRISHTGCWARNPTSGALFWSQEEWRIFGIDPKKTKLSYEMFLQMVHPEDRASLEETSTRAVSEKRAYDIPFRIILFDGSIKHIHSVGKPFFEESGDVTEYIGVSMDVTERKRDEAALQLAQAELARVARQSVVNKLSDSIAHELNQPLAAIMSNAEAALRRLHGDHTNLVVVRDCLKDIVENDAHASEIVGRVRRMIKREVQKSEPIDMEKLLEATHVLMRSEFIRRKISIEVDCPPTPPSVVGDFVQLQQVLVNLLMNAMEAMKGSAPPAPRVVLRA